ncbi:MAG: ATP phosphoribosyltransferase regulatory subunit [Syntrophomonadaceae bacterium]|jgi:ATP phosphoribosyltransferase regulatory subunit
MKNREVPKGVRDLLPEEVRIKRWMEKQAVDLFTSYGYEEVITPTFEFLEVFENGAGRNIRKDLFLFMDREGGILSLRPEMTVSIARLAATHLQEVEYPQRLYYIANVFRHVQPQIAQYREFWQIGIELLGASDIWADAEVITIAVKALQRMGVNDFKLSLNHIGIFNSLISDKGFSGEDRDRIRNLVEKKDLVELSRVLDSLPIDDALKESIAKLPVLHGGLNILEQIPRVKSSSQGSAAFDEVRRLYEALTITGVSDNIVIDMGVLRGLDYYTGVIFEGYSPQLGYGLLGGGRYDNLMGQFGLNRPSTGFAIGIDRLALVLDKKVNEPLRYIVGGNDRAKVYRKACELRRRGLVVEMDLVSASKEVLARRAAERNNCRLIYLDEED